MVELQSHVCNCKYTAQHDAYYTYGSAIPETCENWLGLVNSCIYYICQICEIYQVLPYSVDFKAPEEL